MGEPFKRCGCGATYSPETWRALAWVALVDVERELGFPELADGDEPVPPFELRTCARCGSAISVFVPYEGEPRSSPSEP